MKKRGETTPYEKVESLLPADLLGDIEEETPTIPPWRLRKPVIDTSNLLRSRQPSENAGSKRDDRGSPGKSRLLHGRLEDYGQQKRYRDIYPVEKRTSSHSCISSIEQAAIEDCLIHVKDSYQGRPSI